jgi:hypothetical protein
MSLRYAIVDYPISEKILKSGKVSQTNESARTSNDKTKCIISYSGIDPLFSSYPTFDTIGALNYYLEKHEEIWNEEYDSTTEIRIKENKPFADAKGFRARFKGMKDTIPAGTSKAVELDITEERFINGIRMILKYHGEDDHVTMQVIDKEFTYAGELYAATPFEQGIPVPEGTPWSAVAPDGIMLDEFGGTWYVDDTVSTQPDVIVPYPARIRPGMTIKMIYNSTGDYDVLFKCNFFLHWKAE